MKPKYRESIPLKVKMQLLEDTNGNCYYCGVSLENSIYHIDHIVPVSKGGHQTHTDNIVIACVQCNIGKSSMPIEDYRHWLKPYIKEYNAIQMLDIVNQMIDHPFGNEFAKIRKWLEDNASLHVFYGEKIGKKKEGKYAEKI